MTDQERKAMEMVLEALEGIHVGNMTPMAEENWNKAIKVLRQALAQPEQEPVAWLYDWKDGVEIIKDWITSDFETTKFNCAHNIRPLYATPISEPVKEQK